MKIQAKKIDWNETEGCFDIKLKVSLLEGESISINRFTVYRSFISLEKHRFLPQRIRLKAADVNISWCIKKGELYEHESVEMFERSDGVISGENNIIIIKVKPISESRRREISTKSDQISASKFSLALTLGSGLALRFKAVTKNHELRISTPLPSTLRTLFTFACIMLSGWLIIQWALDDHTVFEAIKADRAALAALISALLGWLGLPRLERIGDSIKSGALARLRSFSEFPELYFDPILVRALRSWVVVIAIAGTTVLAWLVIAKYDAVPIPDMTGFGDTVEIVWKREATTIREVCSSDQALPLSVPKSAPIEATVGVEKALSAVTSWVSSILRQFRGVANSQNINAVYSGDVPDLCFALIQKGPVNREPFCVGELRRDARDVVLQPYLFTVDSGEPFQFIDQNDPDSFINVNALSERKFLDYDRRGKTALILSGFREDWQVSILANRSSASEDPAGGPCKIIPLTVTKEENLTDYVRFINKEIDRLRDQGDNTELAIQDRIDKAIDKDISGKSINEAYSALAQLRNQVGIEQVFAGFSAAIQPDVLLERLYPRITLVMNTFRASDVKVRFKVLPNNIGAREPTDVKRLAQMPKFRSRIQGLIWQITLALDHFSVSRLSLDRKGPGNTTPVRTSNLISVINDMVTSVFADYKDCHAFEIVSTARDSQTSCHGLRPIITDLIFLLVSIEANYGIRGEFHQLIIDNLIQSYSRDYRNYLLIVIAADVMTERRASYFIKLTKPAEPKEGVNTKGYGCVLTWAIAKGEISVDISEWPDLKDFGCND